MPSPKPIPIFDGHNDALLRLNRREGGNAVAAFLDGEEKGHLDLPKARSGGFAGGLFAIFVPSPKRKDGDAQSPGTIAGHRQRHRQRPGAQLSTSQRRSASPLPWRRC